MNRTVRVIVARLIRAFDLVLSPLVLAMAPLLYVIAHLNYLAPVSRRVLDAFRIALVPHHYHSPVVLPGDITGDLGRERPLPGLDLNEAGQLAFLDQLRCREELLAIPRDRPGPGAFGYRNGFFEAGDAEVLYGVIRAFRPARIIEIGGGNSTLVVRLAIARNVQEDAAWRCAHTCIEPFARPWLEATGATVLRSKVEDCPVDLFRSLEENDVLFIDSSHVTRPQGDVVFEYLYLLSRIRPGVLIHVHDVFTPRDYPERWVVKERRLWNEQYLLEAFLSFNRDFEVVAALNWLWHSHRDRLADACPVLCEGGHRAPQSFWFRRVS